MGPVFGEAMLGQVAIAFMLVSLRFLGLFLAAPVLAFRAVPLRLRLAVCLVLGLSMLPQTMPMAAQLVAGTPGAWQPAWSAAAIELAIGIGVGLPIRIALTAVDMAAEVLSMQTGLSFASTFARDVAVPSGVIGELLGMTALALALVMDVHLALLELVGRSFAVVPFGTWPQAWDANALVELIAQAWRFGLVLSAPIIAAHLVLAVVQGLLGRTTPQLNLFSVGFAVSVPLGVVLLVLLAPELPDFVARALKPALDLITEGLDPPRR